MGEGVDRLGNVLRERARAAGDAWAAAAILEQNDLLNAVAPEIPRRTGELAGSGFIERDTGTAGWGSAHAEVVHELDRGRGFKFHQRVLVERVNGIAGRMAERLEELTASGATAESVATDWPETPVTNTAAPIGRMRRQVERVRAGARRRR